MICRIEALNYRGLRHVSQEVGPFEVLVGPNASGKSTFLDVPAFIGDFVRDGLDAAVLFGKGDVEGRARRLDELIFNQSTDRFELALEVAVPEQLVYLNSNSMSEREYRYDVARYELSIGRRETGELGVLDEELGLIDANSRLRTLTAGARAYLELMPQRTLMTAVIEPYPPYWKRVASRDSHSRGIATYFAETQGWAIPNRVRVEQSILAGLPEYPDRFPIAIWIRNLLADGILRLALNSAAMRRPASPSSSRAFDVEGANLPLVIQDLQKDNPTGYGDWVAHIQTILPDVEAIRVYERPEDRFLYLTIKYAGLDAPVPSWLVSDGTLRLMALTLLPYLPDEPRVYLIEEPENGIHPGAIEGVYQSLSSVYNGQVLVATHSPLFLALAEPAQLLVFSKDSAGAVHIVRGNQHPALQHWHGQTDLSTLYAAGVLG